MNGTDYEDLMQRVLDGAATPEEESRLRTALASDAGLRSRYEELQRLFGILESVGDMEPPPGAMQDVLQQVQQIAAGQSRSGLLQRLRSWFGGIGAASRGLAPRPSSEPVVPEEIRASFGFPQSVPALAPSSPWRRSLPMGLSFAAGAVAVAAVFMVFFSPMQSPVRVPGTMPARVENPQLGRPSEDPLRRGGTPGGLLQPLTEARIIDSAVLETPSFQVSVRCGESEGFFFLEIATAAREEGTIEVNWEDETSSVIGVQRSPSQGGLSLRPSGVRLEEPGVHETRLWLDFPPEGPMRVQFRSATGSREATLRTQEDS